MTVALPTIETCDFYTEITDDDRHVGRVHEFPRLRSRPMVSRLDALDDIITRTRDQITRLQTAAEITKQEKHRR